MRAHTTTTAPGTPMSSASGDDDDRVARASDPPDRLVERVAWGSLVVALVPLIVAAARAIRHGWVPVGDSALIAIRSRDVLGGGEMPLLGMWASSSWSVGFNFNHPGPLLFDALAVPAALFPGGTGQVLGATLVNLVAIVGTFLVARRCGGPYVATVAMFEVTALCWALGSAVLVEPWHATSVLLPFLAFLLLTWAVACGDVALLPWAVGVGSFVLATNLSYGVLVPLLLVFGLGAGILSRRRRGDPGREGDRAAPGDGDDGGYGDDRSYGDDRGWGDVRGYGDDRDRGYGDDRDRGASPAPTRSPLLPGRTVVLTVVVIGLVWAQPLYEQFFGRQGEGNVTRLGRSIGESTATLNWSESIRTVAKVLALPPWWVRPSYAEAFPFGPFGNPLPSLLLAVVALVGLAGQIVWFLVVSRREGDRRSFVALVTAAVVVVAALVTANQTPTSLSFGSVAYQLRWLWPVGAFVSFAVGIALVRSLLAARPGWSRLVTLWVGSGPVLMAALNLPASHQVTTAPEATLPVARDLVGQVATAVDDGTLTGPVLMQCDEGIFDAYCEAVMFELQRQDVAFVDGSDIGPRQLGEERRWDGTNAQGLLRVVTGEFALLPRPGAVQVALHEGLDQRRRLELFYLKEDVRRVVVEGRLRLNADGRRVAARGDFEGVRVVDPGAGQAGSSGDLQIDAEAILAPRWSLFGEHRRDLVAMVREDLLDVGGQLADRLERYADLQERLDVETVAVFAEPIPAAPATPAAPTG